jgi:4-diphosphocytidyl-2-C-methyl-D-erythritol kinase
MHWQLSAKVNWTLDILGRRADGFHQLRSWFVALEWGDVLDFEPTNSDSSLKVKGPYADGVPTDSSNLLCQAEDLWRQAGGVAPGLNWVLEKQVPAGAGLGGGSSNAAAALRALQSMASVPLADQDCARLAVRLGSDVDFFYQGGTAELRTGRGEILLGSTEPAPFWLVLALPGLHVATPEVYAALAAEHWTESEGKQSADSCPFPFPEQPGINDLELAARDLVPALQEVGQALNEYARFTMSGSGSTFFHACADSDSAAQLAGYIQHLVPAVIVTQPRKREVAWCAS